MKLTQEQIEEIRKRAEAATPGPWFREYGDVKTNGVTDRKYDEAETIAEMYHDDDDAEFIAKARQDIPALLAHIERLDAYIVHLGEQVESDKEVKFGYYNENKMFKQIIAELQAKNDKLETAIQDALSVGEMQKENFAMEPWASLEEAMYDDEE